MQAARKRNNVMKQDGVLGQLREELAALHVFYGSHLQQEYVKDTVTLLEKWVKDYSKGSKEAEECLRHYGKELLQDVTCRLKAANEDIARMDDESPAAKNFSGKEAHTISKAVRLAADSEKKLEESRL